MANSKVTNAEMIDGVELETATVKCINTGHLDEPSLLLLFPLLPWLYYIVSLSEYNHGVYTLFRRIHGYFFVY